MTTKYRKKPIVIEAFKFGHDPWPAWFNDKRTSNEITTYDEDNRASDGPGIDIHYALINTLEGQMRAENGDYIIRGIKGEVYPCRADIFTATYEAVD